MEFTALHRELGLQPGPLTPAMLDEAIEQGVRETDDLDWKGELPPPKAITLSDFPKDVAAMANSGGGLIVYGIDETQKAATGHIDVAGFDENYERTLRSAAVTGISPPVFGLNIYALGDEGERTVAVVVPNSVDGPHLIYRGEFFGAPIRNDADTVWMRERQVEALYRARFEERRYAREALQNLYDDIVNIGPGTDSHARAWFVGVARPRIADAIATPLSRDDAGGILRESGPQALVYAGRGGTHLLESVDTLDPRPGLRRWIAENTATQGNTNWKESWASVHHDGSVAVATAIGGQRRRDRGGYALGNEIDTQTLECSVADLMGLLNRACGRVSATDYEVRVGIEWNGPGPLTFETHEGGGSMHQSAVVARYLPITVSVRTDVVSSDFHASVYDLITDVVNQAGVREPSLVARRESPT